MTELMFFSLSKCLDKLSFIRVQKQIGKKRCTVSPHRNVYRLLEDSASKFYKHIVNEKIDHIDNVVFGVLCLASSVIINSMSIKSIKVMKAMSDYFMKVILAMFTNDKLRNTLRKGPKYHESQQINRNQNFKLLMSSVEDYAWVTSIRSLIRKRIFKLSRSMTS